ncbi:dynein axonemal intermediate chain 4-like isoform X1 [Bacillus rossius redtenbacheri]|uniref:dynein axonemal intermediate chain 4-like isoform X1 n=1 Tax=Bacillus rossius redtenbacheri TaxID=93214 RepID=UPI002FDE3413
MLNLSARTRNSQLTDEVSKSRTLKELLEYREKITNFCEFAPLPLYDKKYPIADGDAFAVDFILAQDTSKTMLGIQQDTAVSGQLTFERSSYQMFPVIESLETERVDADTRATKDVEVVSLVRHFEDPGELIAEDADKIAVTIVETNTAFLLTLQSATELRGSEEGDLVECANERYRSLKEQNRMLISAETQTHTVRKTTEGVLTDAIGTKDEEQHVTIWKIYDAYASDAASAPEKETSATTHPAVLGSWDALPSLEVPFTTPEEQFQRIVRTKGFQTALTRMEHVLAMNVFSQQQEQFKRGQRRELSVMYNYRLQLLWTFRTREQKGRTVTCMSWNPVNDNLLAVGYGKFYYTERITGMVCCWSAMNPINPQRSYKFQTPVTALNFSTSHPNLLAVGLYDGTVLVLDVAAPDDSVRSHSTRETSPSYQPIWHVQWLEDESSTYAKASGRPQGVPGGHGRGQRAQVLAERPPPVAGGVPGPPGPRVLPAVQPVRRQAAAVVRGGRQAAGVGRGLLGAGARPVGLQRASAVGHSQGAAWSPSHSTVVASIDPSHVYLWDLQRRTCSPMSTETAADEASNTAVAFSASGLNLVVGDSQGYVRVYSLTDMPPAPFRQARALRRSLRKALVTQPQALERLEAL